MKERWGSPPRQPQQEQQRRPGARRAHRQRWLGGQGKPGMDVCRYVCVDGWMDVLD